MVIPKTAQAAQFGIVEFWAGPLDGLKLESGKPFPPNFGYTVQRMTRPDGYFWMVFTDKHGVRSDYHWDVGRQRWRYILPPEAFRKPLDG